MKILSLVIFCPMVLAVVSCASNPPPNSPEPESELEATSQAASSEAAPSTDSETASKKMAPATDALPSKDALRTIEVALQAKSGSKLSGKAIFAETADGVHVEIHVEGVTPGEHGTHVHEKGDCSASDGSSAGGHFNPHTHDHGLPEKTHRHLGDLGNISVGKDGKGTLGFTVAGANLKEGDVNSFVGRALIVHEKKDDGGQPVGNAGGRIGCAEIK